MTTATDFTLHKGKDKTIQVTITDEDGVAKDVTGATITLRIGGIRDDSIALVVVGSIVTALSGIVKAVITDTASEVLNPQVYDYQFEIVDSAGLEQIVREGKCLVKALIPTT